MVAVAIGAAAVVGGGTQIIAGNKAAKAQKSAAKTAAAASQATTDLQVGEARRQYDTTRADFAPYRETGTAALGKLAAMYGVPGSTSGGGAAGYAAGDFTTSPGYQFRMDEGQKAIERSAAARGSLASGGTLKALTRYAQGTAASEFDSYTSRLAQLAGVGQAATGSTADAGQNATSAIIGVQGVNGANQANAAMNIGNARASSYINTASAINGTINNLTSLYLNNKSINSRAGQGNVY